MIDCFRQLANSLLPIPPEDAGLPVTLFPNNEHERTAAVSKSIYDLLKEGSIDIAPGGTPLRCVNAKTDKDFFLFHLGSFLSGLRWRV